MIVKTIETISRLSSLVTILAFIPFISYLGNGHYQLSKIFAVGKFSFTENVILHNVLLMFTFSVTHSVLLISPVKNFLVKFLSNFIFDLLYSWTSILNLWFIMMHGSHTLIDIS